MDQDGYGARRGQSDIDRLIEDCRTLSPLGVERVAAGWEKRGDEQRFQHAQDAALQAAERAGRSGAWEELRNRLLGLTEQEEALIAWQREHGEIGHRAERALLAAALALVAGPDLDRENSELLRRPMAEALPWLLPNRAASAAE